MIDLIYDNKVNLICGNNATGKSTLIRNLPKFYKSLSNYQYYHNITDVYLANKTNIIQSNNVIVLDGIFASLLELMQHIPFFEKLNCTTIITMIKDHLYDTIPNVNFIYMDRDDRYTYPNNFIVNGKYNIDKLIRLDKLNTILN